MKENNDYCKMKKEDISERLLNLSAEVCKRCLKLNHNAGERHIGLQLLRSVTSAGANYEEARSAESRSDFIHKMQIELKELRETSYWLKLLTKLNLVSVDDFEMFSQECGQLIKIFGKSIVTARKNK
jgi:four helix bundle protein